jgi:hypothetical protein
MKGNRNDFHNAKREADFYPEFNSHGRDNYEIREKRNAPKAT